MALLSTLLTEHSKIELMANVLSFSLFPKFLYMRSHFLLQNESTLCDLGPYFLGQVWAMVLHEEEH